MPEEVDTGNPNVYTTYKGRYQMQYAAEATAESANVMLTASNSVQFLADVQLTGYTAGQPFATLPTQCTPDDNVFFYCVLEVGTVISSALVQINPAGEMMLDINVSDGVLHITGAMFNIACNWYRG